MKKKPRLVIQPGSGLDESNSDVCHKGQHFCAFMQAALDEKGPLTEGFSMRGNGAVLFLRKRRKPYLILSVCPWCREEV